MHTQLDLTNRQEAFFLCEEGMLWLVWIVSLVLVAGLPCLAAMVVVIVGSTRSLLV